MELRTAPSARRVVRGRVAAAAGLVLLAGCAELEGLAKFSPVDDSGDLAASADAAGGAGPGSSRDPSQGGPPLVEAGPLAPDAGLHDGGGDAPDAFVPDAAPPAGTDLALGGVVHATATTNGSPDNVVDGSPQTSWTGPLCEASSGGFAGAYSCAQPLTLDLRLTNQGATVNRVIVRSGIDVGGKTTGLVLTATIIVDGVTSYSTPLVFSPLGVADITFAPVASVTSVRIDILTTSAPNPVVTEVELYGP